MALDIKPSSGLPGAKPRGEGDNFRLPTGRGVLSAAEIEALLRPDIPPDAFEELETVAPRPLAELETGPPPGDLEADAAMLASRLTLALRRACGVDAVIKVKTTGYAPLSYMVSRHEGEPVLVLFSSADNMQAAGFTLDTMLATAIIDAACGGAAHPVQTYLRRQLSPLDCSILEEVLRPLAEALDPAFRIACIEPRRSAAHALLPPGKSKLAELSCEIGGLAGKAAFAWLDELPGRSHDALPTAGKPEQDAGALSTTLTARLATLNVPVSQLSDLKPGSVLLLGLPTDQPVELLSGGHRGVVVAEGDVGRKGNRIAVRIAKRIRTKA